MGCGAESARAGLGAGGRGGRVISKSLAKLDLTQASYAGWARPWKPTEVINLRCAMRAASSSIFDRFLARATLPLFFPEAVVNRRGVPADLGRVFRAEDRPRAMLPRWLYWLSRFIVYPQAFANTPQAFANRIQAKANHFQWTFNQSASRNDHGGQKRSHEQEFSVGGFHSGRRVNPKTHGVKQNGARALPPSTPPTLPE